MWPNVTFTRDEQFRSHVTSTNWIVVLQYYGQRQTKCSAKHSTCWLTTSLVSRRWAHQRSYSMSGPVSTEMDDRLRTGKPPRYVNVTSHPAQLRLAPTLSRTGNEHRPKCGDALRLGSKGRHGSFHLWMHMWVAGKTVWSFVNTCHTWATFCDESDSVKPLYKCPVYFYSSVVVATVQCSREVSDQFCHSRK